MILYSGTLLALVFLYFFVYFSPGLKALNRIPGGTHPIPDAKSGNFKKRFRSSGFPTRRNKPS